MEMHDIVNLGGNYYSMEWDKGNNKMKLTLGNLTDAGWYWDGDEKDIVGFVVRLADSKAWDDFVKDAKESGVSLNDLKPLMQKRVQKNGGLYEVSGDNRVWHFGEGFDYDNEDYQAKEDLKEHGYSDEQIEAIIEKTGENLETDYDEFAKMYGPEYRKNMGEALDKSSSFEDFYGYVAGGHDKLDYDGAEWLMEYTGFVYRRAQDKAIDELKFGKAQPKKWENIAKTRSKLGIPSTNPKGWHNEPINHALASKGIKVGKSRTKR